MNDSLVDSVAKQRPCSPALHAKPPGTGPARPHPTPPDLLSKSCFVLLPSGYPAPRLNPMVKVKDASLGIGLCYRFTRLQIRG